MSTSRRKEITHHIPESTVDEKLTEADDDHIVRRLSFVKNLYLGDTLKDAVQRVGRSEATGSRWAEQWNEGGLVELAPNFGGGRPPKLDEQEQETLLERLRDDQPWKPPEIQHLLNTEFDVEYHPASLSEVLRTLGLSYSIPRTKRPSRPDNAEKFSTSASIMIGLTSGHRDNENLDCEFCHRQLTRLLFPNLFSIIIRRARCGRTR